MPEAEDLRIQRMNLSRFPTPATDTVVEDEDYIKRTELLDALKSSDMCENKPRGDDAPFEVKECTSDKEYISCHLPVTILKIGGTILNKLSKSTPMKKVPAQYTWAMEETGEWCKEQLTHDVVKGKNYMADFKIASNPETYALPDYTEYVPNHVINAEEKYKQLYLNGHRETYGDLNIDDIHITYYMLKCNYAILRSQAVPTHYKKTHRLPNAASSLRKREIITVNTTLEFKITDLTHFESTGPNKQIALLDSVHTHVIARGVFDAGTSRNGATLQKSMSSAFLDRMEKACTPSYYARFKFALKNTIKKDVDNDFTCSWEDVESAMYSSIAQDNKVSRLHTFNEIKSSNFYGKSLELTITDVDEKVDAVWGNSEILCKDTKGRTVSAYGYTIIHKYTIILGITKHLGAEFDQVKDYIEVQITNMLENLNTLMDIQEFREKLITEFTTRNVIRIFRSKLVPQQRKAEKNVSSAGEGAGKKEGSEFSQSAKEEFNGLKTKPTKDWETAKEFAKKFIEMTDESNKNSTLFSLPAVFTMLKEKNWRLCGECLSSNCQLLQHLARKNKTPPRFIGKCKGKVITFGEVPEALKGIETKIIDSKKRAETNKKGSKGKKAATGNNAAAEAKPSSNYSNDVDEFLFNNQDILRNGPPRQNSENSLRNCPVEISTLPEITEDSLPVWEDLQLENNHTCYICGKQNMNVERYNTHVFTTHQADLETPIFEEFDQARGQFLIDLRTSTTEELKTIYCDYDSEKERRYSEDDSGEESNTANSFKPKDEKNQQLNYSSSANSSSISSSEGSSKGSLTKQKKKLRVKKKSLHSVPMNKYNTDRQEISQLQEEKYKDFHQELQKVSTENVRLERKNKLNEDSISDMKNSIKILQDSSRKSIESNQKTNAMLNQYIADKQNSKESEKKEKQELISKFQDLMNQNKEESKSREFFFTDIENKYSNLENEAKLMKNTTETSSSINPNQKEIMNTENIQLEDSKQTNFSQIEEKIMKSEIIETEIPEQKFTSAVKVIKPITIGTNETSNLAVKGHIKNQVELKQQSTPSNSVLNRKHKATKSLNIQQSSTEKETSITGPAKVNNPIEVNNFTKTKNPNISELLIKGAFSYFQLITTEIFKVIFSMLNNGMAWGVILVILLKLTATNATIVNDEGAMSMSQSNNSMKMGPMIIYSTASIITRTYVMNMSTVEEDLDIAINNSLETIRIQEQICKNKPISCPLSQQIISNNKRSIQQSANTISTLKTICQNDDKVHSHLKLDKPIIFSTVMGSSTSRTMITTAHSAALSQAHKLTNTPAPERSTKPSNKNNLWETPDEMTRHSDKKLQRHFKEAIKSMIIQNRENNLNQDTQHMLSIAEDTAMVITSLVPTNASSTHCSTRLLVTTLLVSTVDPTSRLEVINTGDKIFPVNSSETNYLLLPKNNIIADHTQAFNRDINLVKRICWAARSINATTHQTKDPLFQSFNITSPHNITIIESCPDINSWSSKIRTLAPHTQFNLPVTCKITSPELNCSAVTIRSNETNKNIFPNLHMQIILQQWDQEKNKSFQDQTSPSQPEKRLPCAGTTLLILSVTIIGITILLKVAKRAYIKARYNAMLTPSAPYEPQISITPLSPLRNPNPSTETTQEVAGLNQLLEANMRASTHLLNAAINLNQLMESSDDIQLQTMLDEYLMTAMDMNDHRHNEVTLI